MRKSILLFQLLAILVAISCDNRLNDYDKLVNEADSIIFSYNIEGKYREAQILTESSELEGIKELLTRKMAVSDVNHFIGSTRIQLFNSGTTTGTIQISETEVEVNFSSQELEFGSGLTYGLGQYVGELRNEFLKKLQYINHKTLILPNRLTDESKPTLKNQDIDTAELFGIWTIDPEGPHADFWLTKDSYYIVDYDGNGHMTYELDGRTLTVNFDDGPYVVNILSTANDTLRVYNKEYDSETVYTRWKN